MRSTRVVLVLFAMVRADMAASLKLSPDLANVSADAMVNVIIQFRVPPTQAHHARIAGFGGTLKRSLDLISAAHYAVPAQEMDRISADPDIAYITPDRSVRAMQNHAGSAVYADVALQNGYDGSGVTIALIDSGLESPRVVFSESFVAGEDSTDRYGHGTNLAGMAVAPSSQIVNLKVLDSHGVGTDSAVIAALGQAVKLQATYRIGVVNLSLGRPVSESYAQDPLCQAVENAWAHGIVVVVAAGNGGRNNSAGENGYATITSPANDPYVITVGAMKTNGTPSRADDTMSSYSSKGPTLIDHIVKPDLVAPGGAAPFQGGGTSMAAAIVSGAAALLLQKDRTLTPDQVKARLMKTAGKSFPASSTVYDAAGKSYTTQYDIFTVGAGYLDIWAALNDGDLANGSALSPTALRDPKSGKVTVVNTNGAVWGGAPVWTAVNVWGSSVWVDGPAAEWGKAEVWGAGAVWGGFAKPSEGTANSYGAVWGGGPTTGKN